MVESTRIVGTTNRSLNRMSFLRNQRSRKIRWLWNSRGRDDGDAVGGAGKVWCARLARLDQFPRSGSQSRMTLR